MRHTDVRHASVAVITPTKNRLALLRDAMDSVQKQSLEAWEHIIVDDGSDDGTAEEVARRAQADPRVRYLRREGQISGANACRNLGITASTAELLVFLDSDDLLEPDCLRRRVQCMQRNTDLDFATFQTGVFRATVGDLGRQMNPELLGDDLHRFLLFEIPWIITGPVWRKDALLRIGQFDESLLSWQDVDLHIRAIASGCRYLRFPDVDHHVRWQYEPTKTSIEQFRSDRHLRAVEPLLAKLEQVITSGPGMNWVRQRALCSLYYMTAERWVVAGNRRAALRTWKTVRERSLGSRILYLSGWALLVTSSLGTLGHWLSRRVTHNWKGWMRFRTNPELVVR